MALVRFSLLLVTLTVVSACSTWQPPPPDLFDGWRETPTSHEGTEEWVKGQSVIQIPPVIPLTPNEYATRFDDAGTTTGALTEILGPDVANVEVGPVRRHGDVTWVDTIFDGGGARRKIRFAWFAVPEGSRTFRLIAPVSEWNSHDLSSFHEVVRHQARQVQLAN